MGSTIEFADGVRQRKGTKGVTEALKRVAEKYAHGQNRPASWTTGGGGAIDACQNAEGSVLVGEEPDAATADEAAAGARQASAS